MNREDFPMLRHDIIYFDNGATSLKPKCVIDKMVDYYENYSGTRDDLFRQEFSLQAVRKWFT